jgi:hypothetical protein
MFTDERPPSWAAFRRLGQRGASGPRADRPRDASSPRATALGAARSQRHEKKAARRARAQPNAACRPDLRGRARRAPGAPKCSRGQAGTRGLLRNAPLSALSAIASPRPRRAARAPRARRSAAILGHVAKTGRGVDVPRCVHPRGEILGVLGATEAAHPECLPRRARREGASRSRASLARVSDRASQRCGVEAAGSPHALFWRRETGPGRRARGALAASLSSPPPHLSLHAADIALLVEAKHT